jgi:hypothetical protein
VSRAAFCQQRALRLKTLDRYLTRYRKQPAARNQPQQWMAVEVSGPGGGGAELAVLLAGGRRIEVQRGFDAATLRQLMAVLEQA